MTTPTRTRRPSNTPPPIYCTSSRIPPRFDERAPTALFRSTPPWTRTRRTTHTASRTKTTRPSRDSNHPSPTKRDRAPPRSRSAPRSTPFASSNPRVTIDDLASRPPSRRHPSSHFFLPPLHSSTRRARVTISTRAAGPCRKIFPGDAPAPHTRARLSVARHARRSLARDDTRQRIHERAFGRHRDRARGRWTRRRRRSSISSCAASSFDIVVPARGRRARGERTGGNRHRDDDASDGERAGADEASLVPYTVRVAKPPRFEDLGVHRLPKNTACGETIEVERGWFIVHRVTTMYNLVRGKYEKDGRRLDVQRGAVLRERRARGGVSRRRRRRSRVSARPLGMSVFILSRARCARRTRLSDVL